MKNITVTYTKTFNLEFDIESEEFKNALSDYKDVIYKKGKSTDMLHHVAHSIVMKGKGEMVEGVGFLHEDKSVPAGMFSGIKVSNEEDEICIAF